MVHFVFRSLADAFGGNVAVFKGYEIDPKLGPNGGFILDPERETMPIKDQWGNVKKDPQTNLPMGRPCTDAELRARAEYYASIRLDWKAVSREDATTPFFVNPMSGLDGKALEAFDTAEEAKEAAEKSAAEEPDANPTPPPKSDARAYREWLQKQCKLVNDQLSPQLEKIQCNAKNEVMEAWLREYKILE